MGLAALPANSHYGGYIAKRKFVLFPMDLSNFYIKYFRKARREIDMQCRLLNLLARQIVDSLQFFC